MSDNGKKPPDENMLLSPSRLRRYVERHGGYELMGIHYDTRLGRDFLDELNRKVLAHVDCALRNIRGKKRKTLKAEDLR